MINQLILTNQTERFFKEKILKDLATYQDRYPYFQHTLKMASLLKKQVGRGLFSQFDYKQLLPAVYGYHWGCLNMFGDLHQGHAIVFSHQQACFELAAQKLERVMSANLFKYYSQSEILMIAELLLDQFQLERLSSNLSKALSFLVNEARFKI